MIHTVKGFGVVNKAEVDVLNYTHLKYKTQKLLEIEGSFSFMEYGAKDI